MNDFVLYYFFLSPAFIAMYVFKARRDMDITIGMFVIMAVTAIIPVWREWVLVRESIVGFINVDSVLFKKKESK